MHDRILAGCTEIVTKPSSGNRRGLFFVPLQCFFGQERDPLTSYLIQLPVFTPFPLSLAAVYSFNTMKNNAIILKNYLVN